MNFSNIINEIEKVDPEFQDRISPRRQIFKNFAGFTGKLALAAIPAAFGGLLQKAYAGPAPADVFAVLNFALTLEYLEATFYAKGIAKGSALVPNNDDLAAIRLIGKHEAEHVAFLKAAISAANGTPIPKPKFDLSGGSGSGNGPFKDAFDNYQLFLAVAQTFEDTGVRAYKGQAPNLMGTPYLTPALNIHSVEARHASHIRNMRKRNNFASLKPWITGKDTGGIGALVQANYDGEENTMQAGVQIVHINGKNISTEAASEAFDEPLTKDQVVDLVKIFFA